MKSSRDSMKENNILYMSWKLNELIDFYPFVQLFIYCFFPIGIVSTAMDTVSSNYTRQLDCVCVCVWGCVSL